MGTSSFKAPISWVLAEITGKILLTFENRYYHKNVFDTN